MAAASLDDVAAQALKAGTKSAGVVIDDAAVTPRYVVGFAAEREIPIVLKIARGSLKNKLLILLPIALLLSFFLPSAITPLLMLGGLYLCYEGVEKLYEKIAPHAAHGHEANVGLAPEDPKELEARKVAGAIRTDFILSAEIMAIALATVSESTLVEQGVILAVVGFGITAAVYGAVAAIVKADDLGVKMAASEGHVIRTLGRGIVGFMPTFLKVLAAVGTAAMIWVGGGILIHGLEVFGIHEPGHSLHHFAEKVGHAAPVAPGLVEWAVNALGAGIFGIIVGAMCIPFVEHVVSPAWRLLGIGSRSAAAQR